MKLELKHLAPYLPYDLNIKNLYGDILIMVTDHNICDTDEVMGIEYCYGIGDKPLLRPLSLSNDEIKVMKEELCLDWCTIYDDWLSVFEDNLLDKEVKILQAPYLIFNWFLSEHKDVFGLIPKGLAIDVDALKRVDG
jgi:hypothetical protein